MQLFVGIFKCPSVLFSASLKKKITFNKTVRPGRKNRMDLIIRGAETITALPDNDATR